jgi:hypothetical protein
MNALGYRWFYYPEPGSFVGNIEIDDSGLVNANFKAPAVDKPETIHIILEVSDQGEPPLTRYRRIIVTVLPF